MYEISTREPSVIFSRRRRNETSYSFNPGWSSSGRIRSIRTGRRERRERMRRWRRAEWEVNWRTREEEDEGPAAAADDLGAGLREQGLARLVPRAAQRAAYMLGCS